MIVLSGILPHSPLLHESIGADVKHALEETIRGVQQVADAIYATHPDTVVLISDQPIAYRDHISIHIQDPVQFDLSEFGNFSMRNKVTPDLQLIDQIQRVLRKQQQPVTLDSVHALHFAAAVPLSFILKRNPNIQLIAITPPQDMEAKEIYEIGRALQDILIQSSKRIVVIAAGDGSHALNERSPNPATNEGRKFDEYMQHILANRNASSLLSLNEDMAKSAIQTIYFQTLLLFGILHGIQTSQKLHSYAAPFGVGYFVASYHSS